mgnify:CR=1 FL=1
MKRVQSTSQNWGMLGLLIVAVALIVVAALPGGSAVGTPDDPLPADWDKDLSSETALVTGKQATGGLKIAGVRLREKTYRLDLDFLAEGDCSGSDPTSVATRLCEGPDGLMGEVVGLTINGETMVSSRVEVSRECYQLITTTDPWPSFPECAVIVGD